jgi:hypothetical protein
MTGLPIPREPFVRMWESGVSVADMARQLGVSKSAIHKARERFGLPMRQPKKSRAKT